MGAFSFCLRKRRSQYWWMILIYILTFFVILPLICNQLKFSIYYGIVWPRNIEEDSNALRRENNHRLLLAQQHIKHARNQHRISEQLKFAAPKNGTDIIITVITVSRKISSYDPSYLTQTVSKLTEQLMNVPTSFTYGLVVCNVDGTPGKYDEAMQLSRFFHTVVKYKYNTIINEAKIAKEKEDYTYCLKQSLVYNPRFVLLMEDDAYPCNDMLPVLEHSIQNIFDGKVCTISQQPSKVAYLKLYHPDRLLNFISTEVYRLFELASGVLLLLTMLTILNDTILKLSVSWKCYIMAAIYIVLFALAIGRQNFLWLRKLSKHFQLYVPAPSCCTPANLYSYDGAIAMIDSFSGKSAAPSHAKDMLLDEFLEETNFVAFYVEPNIFQHIGQYSSLRKGSILDPYVV